MKKANKIPRRDFLLLVGITACGAMLKACGKPKQTLVETAVPEATESPVPPRPAATQNSTRHIVPEMVRVEAGEFQMGSTDGYEDEQPTHTVILTKPFYMGKYEVTFAEYDAFCDDTMRHNKPDDRGQGRGSQPVIGVDWHDAVEYCNWLSEREGLTACYSGKGKVTKCDFSSSGYRLPTEAEWEYAARGGQNSQDFIFAGSDDADRVAWYGENSNGVTHPVGQKAANELELYDMSGNMFEWCWDWYVEDYYQDSPAVDPQGPSLPRVENPWDLVRVRRSGSWRENADSVRTTMRSFDGPTYPGDNGFRLLRLA